MGRFDFKSRSLLAFNINKFQRTIADTVSVDLNGNGGETGLG